MVLSFQNPDQWVRKIGELYRHSNFPHNKIQAQHFLLFVWHSQITDLWVPLPQLDYVMTSHHVFPVIGILNFPLFYSKYFKKKSAPNIRISLSLSVLITPKIFKRMTVRPLQHNKKADPYWNRICVIIPWTFARLFGIATALQW